MVKSQKLPENILTPTTKAADHDVPVTPDEVWSLWYHQSLLFLLLFTIYSHNYHTFEFCASLHKVVFWIYIFLIYYKKKKKKTILLKENKERIKWNNSWKTKRAISCQADKISKLWKSKLKSSRFGQKIYSELFSDSFSWIANDLWLLILLVVKQIGKHFTTFLWVNIRWFLLFCLFFGILWWMTLVSYLSASFTNLLKMISLASLGGSCDAFVSQIVKRGLMTQADYDEASRKALSLFEYGQVYKLCWLAFIANFCGLDLIEM